MNFTEEELIEGCKANKARYQEALYNKYGSVMMGICLRYAYTSFEAEDIFHDAFIKVFKNMQAYKGAGSFEGWMKHIFVNTAINHFHKNKKRYYHGDLEDAGDMPQSDQDTLSQIDADELLDLIARLPEGYRMVFNLFAIEGYGHKEISEMLGISEGTSKSQLAKARAYLKKSLLKHHSSDYVAEQQG
ncbi:MAG: sigma-70 family RNA polymerase sigma factor [Bacteroidota bacterium]